MKVYISADIEGVTGIAHWDDAHRDRPDYAEFRERMTAEAPAIRRTRLPSNRYAKRLGLL